MEVELTGAREGVDLAGEKARAVAAAGARRTMTENKTSAAALPAGQDPAARARDQIGALFLVLALALSCGAVAAARDPHLSFFSHAVWWWVGWSLLMLTPALIFTIVPWMMRTVFGRPPGGAVQDSTLAFYGVLGFSVALGALDALVVAAFSSSLHGVAGMALGYGLAPLVATPAALRVFRGRQAWLPVLLPIALYLNALLVEWAGGFAGHPLTR